MRESGDRTAVIVENDVWIRHDSSPNAHGEDHWLFVGDVRGLQDWIDRGCPDRPDFRPPGYPWARVIHALPGMGGRRTAEPADKDLLAKLAPAFAYL